jgi:hypothetical protein
MNARLLTTATLVSVLTGVLPARAASPQLLNLVMPDAKVLAGVNVDSAKSSPFGQYVLSQMQLQDPHLQEITTLTGFDPTRDVHELLVATNTTAEKTQHSGLVLALGNFDPARINALVLAKAGANAISETYQRVTIIEDQKQQSGYAFLSTTIAAAGDVPNVKAAIDRLTVPSSLPSPVVVQIGLWSAQDAWAITTVPPSSLHPTTGMPPIPGIGPGNQNTALQNIQQVAGGVKFGANVTVTGQAQAANETDAKQMGDTVKLLASLAQLQSNGDPNLLALVQSLNVSTNGSVLNVSVSLPQDTLVQILKSGPKAHPAHRPAQRKM